MTLRLIPCAALLALSLSVQSSTAASQNVAPADSAEVVRTLETMFAALRTKNADGLRAAFHENARMTLLRPAQDGGTRVVVLTADQFIASATNPANAAIDEPIRNVRVQIDGPLATAWAEYQVRIDGKFSHCGYDAFHLVRVDTAWKVLNVADTYRQQGCGEIWK